MRKPIEDKSPLAAWATLSREGAGMSVEEVVDALAARGHAVKAATIRGIEGGSKGASVRLRRLMAEVYGVNPPGQKDAGPSAMGEAGILAAVVREAIAEQTQVLSRAIEARSDVVVSLLEELKLYREQAAQAQRVELDLIQALPRALATALALERASKPADDPEPGPREPAAIPQS